MSLSLLTPLFLAGLIAVAVPILVHLTNRDRKDVIRFPSLKFLTKLPYRQMRRQRIQHWLLFAMRTLAIILIVAAELIAAEKGIGAYVQIAGSLFATDQLIAGVAILSVLGLTVSWLIGKAEKFFLRWRG